MPPRLAADPRLRVTLVTTVRRNSGHPHGGVRAALGSRPVTDFPPPPQTPPPPPPPSPGGGYVVTPIGPPPEQLGGVYYSTGLVILLTIVTLGIWGALWTYRTSEDLKRYSGEGFGGALGVVIYLLLSVVLMFTIPNDIAKMYERDGRQ